MQRRPKRALLVEFLGLPGAGKTTLVNAIKPLLSSQGLSVATKEDLHFWRNQQHRFINIVLLFKNPLKTIQLFFNILRFLYSLDPNHKVSLKRALMGILINMQLEAFCKDRKVDVVLMDQGAIQNLWSIAAFSSRYCEKALQVCVNDSFNLKYLDTLYVNVIATPELSVTRLAERNTSDSRFDVLDNDHRYVVINKSYQLMASLFEMLNIAKQPFVFVEAADGVDKKALVIFNEINKLVKC